MSKITNVLGVDVGGVIINFIPHLHSDLDFRGDNYLHTPVIPGSIESIAALNAEEFAGNVHLVSRYHVEFGPERTVEWLRAHDFFSTTGIPEHHFHPCEERAGKVAIATRIGATHFIDDRAEVLETMLGRIPYLYLFQELGEDPRQFAHVLTKVKKYSEWSELLSELRRSV